MNGRSLLLLLCCTTHIISICFAQYTCKFVSSGSSEALSVNFQTSSLAYDAQQQRDEVYAHNKQGQQLLNPSNDKSVPKTCTSDKNDYGWTTIYNGQTFLNANIHCCKCLQKVPISHTDQWSLMIMV